MATICTICGKKQSGFLEDFPLSKEQPQLRICANCQVHLQTLEDDGNADEVAYAKNYFDEIFSRGASLEVTKRVQDAIEKREQEGLTLETEIKTTNPYIDQNFSDTAKSYGEKTESFLDSLYKDIGKKIKSWAIWIFISGAIAAVIYGLIMIFDNLGDDFNIFIQGLLIVILGPFAAYVSSFLIYGLGELIDKTCDNEKRATKSNEDSEEIKTLLKRTNALLESMQNDKK